jgi:hypothetical protein
MEILIWVTLSAQILPLAVARGKSFTQIMLPILKSPTNKGNNKITELRTILQRESQNS